MTKRTDARRRLPSIDLLLGHNRAIEWIATWGRESVKRELNTTLREMRSSPEDAVWEACEDLTSLILERTGSALASRQRASLGPVLNGTGVVLHTNLGRAPLSAPAAAAVGAVSEGYSNLEFDLERGVRGSRYDHCTRLLCELTGSEASLVVNNNAAAVVLALNELSLRKRAIVSRGELVEIGGSFRIPDLIESSGAILTEVGTTNRTHVDDFRRAIGADTGVLLKVHPSNYRMDGFVLSVSLDALVAIGREHGIPVVHDLGSGLLAPSLLPRLAHEPAPADSVRAGADLVTWSGDKLLGGPQAGILHGSTGMIARLRKNPLLRAFRVDKMTLAALEATLRLYREPETARQVPAVRMLAESAVSVEGRARRALSELGPQAPPEISVRHMDALVGGGAFPGLTIDSAGWEVRRGGAAELERRCRAGDPPLIGRIVEDRFLVDVRTLLPGQEAVALRILSEALGA